jgi:hypothetical protein
MISIAIITHLTEIYSYQLTAVHLRKLKKGNQSKFHCESTYQLSQRQTNRTINASKRVKHVVVSVNARKIEESFKGKVKTSTRHWNLII